MAVTLSPADMEQWLSQARYDRYLDVAGQDESTAVSLYAWNTRAASAALTEVWHLEVAMRNAYDRALTARYGEWMSPSSSLWRRRTRDAKRQQVQEQENRKTIDALVKAGIDDESDYNRVIADTSFGMWCGLTDGAREPMLWTEALRLVYPHGVNRGSIHELAAVALRFRNRLSHNEPVFGKPHVFAQCLRCVRILHALILPASADWAAASHDIPSIVNACPVPGLIAWDHELDNPPHTLIRTGS